MKISIITFDMSHNCLGRAYLLGRVLQRRYEVDIHGFFYDYWGSDQVWPPCDTGEFDYKYVVARKFPGFFKSAFKLLNTIDGDIIIASKLRLPSYGVGMLGKILKSRPLILDIDDTEASWNQQFSFKKKLRGIRNPIGQLNTEFIEKFVGFADEITTVSSQLRERYGRGVIIPHGKDTDHLDPRNYDRENTRRLFQLTDYKVIMFLGTPRPHKGLEDIISAIKLLDRQDVRLMIVGSGSDPKYEKKLSEQANGKIILHPLIPFNDIPKYLSMADLVVLPQRRIPHSHGQIPAKIFDAMAMAKPIIATNVSDMPIILKNCGIIVEPEDIPALAGKMEQVFSQPEEAALMGAQAREKCIQEYSWDVMESKLVEVIENL